MALLEYENQMFLDAFHDDGLLILAKGLGVDRVFTNFLKVYCDPESLVLVLNTNTSEEEYFIEQLESTQTKPLPKVVTSEYSINDRQTLYKEGGVLFVTSRILVVDLLTDRVPVHLISGILVYKAHRIMESCQEAFILRLYRMKNKKGFIKAFSESPVSFTAGFCHVERVMKSLFVRKLFLWPRFQASIRDVHQQHKVDVVEITIELTPLMVACQRALLDLIDACIKELKRFNPSLDTDEITVENAITKSFDKIVKLHLDPVWHQLSGKTKQLIADVKTLKLILEYMTQYDCVSFYNLIQSIRLNEKTFGQNSGWLFLDAADSLFVNARERVYGHVSKKFKTGEDKKENEKNKEPLLEECPKWKALTEVLDEIKEINNDASNGIKPGRTIIAVADERTCDQLREYLCDGGKKMLKRLFDKTLAAKGLQKQDNVPKTFHDKDTSKGKGPGKGKSSNSKGHTESASLTLTQMMDMNSLSHDAANRDDEVAPPGAYGLINDPGIIILPLQGSRDSFSLSRILNAQQPTFIILYDADVAFIRQIEVFKASNPLHTLRVYFIMYTGSTEEQRYLTSLRKEREAFMYLIKEKATMVIPEEREGKSVDDPALSRDQAAANTTTNSRKGGNQTTTQQQQRKVIVDMREFRSELPSLIHRRGIEIEPVTLEVGDYILTPDMCVERKSLSDLIGSLNSGRLYNQCVAMCRTYKHPVLLIEFDANKPFALQGKYQLSSELNSTDTQSKLTLLTIHFPRMRLLWCQSPYATAQIFEELKLGRAEPDATVAMAITGDNEAELMSGKYNPAIQDMLLKMPGLNSKNVFKLMNNMTDLKHLVLLSEKELSETFGNPHTAKLLHSFLHRKYDDSLLSSSSSTNATRALNFNKIGGNKAGQSNITKPGQSSLAKASVAGKKRK